MELGAIDIVPGPAGSQGVPGRFAGHSLPGGQERGHRADTTVPADARGSAQADRRCHSSAASLRRRRHNREGGGDRRLDRGNRGAQSRSGDDAAGCSRHCDCAAYAGAVHRPFAERLNSLCTIAVKEAEPQRRSCARPRPRRARQSPPSVAGEAATPTPSTLKNGPLVCRHRPSVDVLFRSAACVAGSNAVGVIAHRHGRRRRSGNAGNEAGGSIHHCSGRGNLCGLRHAHGGYKARCRGSRPALAAYCSIHSFLRPVRL